MEPWNPKASLLSEDDLDDSLGMAALMYRDASKRGQVWYSHDTVRCVWKETTFAIWNMIHGAKDHNPSTKDER